MLSLAVQPGAASLSVRGASLIGREHVRVGRNNQDGFAVASAGDRLVGVVTDGCSSQPRSEVGAQLGAQFLANWLARAPMSSDLPKRATDALCGWVYRTAGELDAQSLDLALDTYFLFTFLAVVCEGEKTQVFGMGDGALWVDGQVVRLDAGPQNAPEYCAYRLGKGRRPEPQLHFVGEATRVAVMTDGFDAMLASDEDRARALVDGPLKNPQTLQRRLNVLGEVERFADDATLVVLGV